jgi:hypothetical protein
MIVNDMTGLGRIEVTDVPISDAIKAISATYTYSGKVLLTYKTDNDIDEKDYFNLAVLNDDGTDFKNIFSGFIRPCGHANGVRFMCFHDNKRILLGDYVLECYPDIDNCERSELMFIEYPCGLRNNEFTSMHWSEVIIAPDNEHMAWTALRNDGVGAIDFIGDLKRYDDHYVIENAQIISSLWFAEKDPEHDGYILPKIPRGGEVKQFVRGGKAISLVGTMRAGTADSIVQYLNSFDLEQITTSPSYEETTIFSPDEKLGVVMSTRASKRTNTSIFGLMPRPHGILISGGLMMLLYLYSVAGVRSFRRGNIGPIMIDIECSKSDPSYLGAVLCDPEENWVYLSPMSWHPNGKKAMWPEMLRLSITNGKQIIRIRKAELLDYKPSKTVCPEATPMDIPYAISDLSLIDKYIDGNIDGKIAGKSSGHIEYKKGGSYMKGQTSVTYMNYSDDGKTYWNGSEIVELDLMGKSCYRADVEMAGEHTGEMKLRAVFLSGADGLPRLSFKPGADGKPESYGRATFDGVALDISEMAE